MGREAGLFPSYMTITGDDPEEREEERRLCYVGITRAEQKLTMTAARMRMGRGETRYNKLSRFVKEIPQELLDMGSGSRLQAGASGGYAAEKPYVSKASRQPFHTLTKGSQLTAQKGGMLSYGVGDRVRHVKFGEGTVLDIREGGRDYEVTVEFDMAGVRKMFAMFARLEKI